MPAITTNHLAFWFGTAASIPSGWQRWSSGDDRMLRGQGTNETAGTTGGATTHTHDFSHNHTGSQHVHPVSANSVTTIATALGGITGSAALFAQPTHSHASTDSEGPLAGDDDLTTTLTTASYSNLPPSLTCIYIQPTSDAAGIPDLAVAPSIAYAGFGWAACDGRNSTPNLAGIHIVGAAAGADGGASVGTASDHVHDLTHTQSIAAHEHEHFNAVASATTSATDTLGSGLLATKLRQQHHNLTSDSQTGTTASAVPSCSSRDTIPRTAWLSSYQNRTGAVGIHAGMILPFVGTRTQLAGLADWELCDGTNGTPAMTESYAGSTFDSDVRLTTTGNSTHFHTVGAHTHGYGAHTHSTSIDSVYDTTVGAGVNVIGANTAAQPHDDDHTWTWSASSSTTSSYSGSTSTVSNEYLYVQVFWAMYAPPATVRIRGGRIRGGRIAA